MQQSRTLTISGLLLTDSTRSGRGTRDFGSLSEVPPGANGSIGPRELGSCSE